MNRYETFLARYGDKVLYIFKQAMSIRFSLIKEKGTPEDVEGALAGKCIVASDKLVDILKAKGFDCRAYQVWCLYEEFESCSDYCYEEHWIVAVNIAGTRIYFDPTIQQFQWAFNKKLPAVYVGFTLPGYLLPREPGKDTLRACGWTNWYNNGDYDNSGFDYYKHLRHEGNNVIMKYIKSKMQ